MTRLPKSDGKSHGRHPEGNTAVRSDTVAPKSGNQPPSGNPRAVALDILLDIFEKDTLSHLGLRRGLKAHPEYDKQQRAFLTRLVEGTVERRLELDYIIGRYSSVPVKKMKPIIRGILRMGVYQLLYMDAVPDSAVCNEAVKLAAKRGFGGLKGFVNGLLRKIAAEKEDIPYPAKDTAQGLSVRYSMPLWLVDAWLSAYGMDQTRQMLGAVLTERPLIVHHNQSGPHGDQVRASLAAQDVQTQPHPYHPDAWILRGVDHLESLEAFVKGWIQPQDISSQLTSSLAVHAMTDRWRQLQSKDMPLSKEILCSGSTHKAAFPDDSRDLTKGNSLIFAPADKRSSPALRILDVCAAPGGKSLYIADAAMALSIPAMVLSRDLTEDKTAMIEENRRRLHLNNLQVQPHDALVFDPVWEQAADIVIADLPCSGLGIMGRKNDIKYRMTPEIQQDLAALQRQILAVIWRYVKPGGYLLYSTCTINPAENDDNFRWLQETYSFSPVDIRPWLPEVLRTQSAAGGSLQLLPGIHDSDGFYLTALQRIQ